MKQPFFSGLAFQKNFHWNFLENCLRFGRRQVMPMKRDTGGQSDGKCSVLYRAWKTQALLQVLSQGQCTHGDKGTQQDLKGAGTTRCSLLQCARSRSPCAQFRLDSSHMVLLSQLRCRTSSQKTGGAMRSWSEGCLQKGGDPNLPISKRRDFTSITHAFTLLLL